VSIYARTLLLVPQTQEREFTLTELAEHSGVAERTIRFYIARGVLDGPLRSGRGASYGEAHLERLRLIRAKQRAGLTLAQIERERSDGRQERLPEPAGWWVYAVGPDVTVQVRGGLSPWRNRQLRAALEKFAAEILRNDDEPGKDKR